MNFETYKKLTDEEKTEWNFKFGNVSFPHVSMMHTIMLYSTLTVFLSLSLVIIHQYATIKLDVFKLVKFSILFSFIMIGSWVVDYVTSIIIFFNIKRKEKIWLESKLNKVNGKCKK